jgi:hypothetical protein
VSACLDCLLAFLWIVKRQIGFLACQYLGSFVRIVGLQRMCKGFAI